jgi:translocator protein
MIGGRRCDPASGAARHASPMITLDRAVPSVEAPAAWSRRLTDAVIIATPLAVGGLSSILTMDGLRLWYRTIERPDWNPPNWVFGPVWTTLYLMMGLALVQVVRSDRDRLARQIGLGLFALQLLLNFGWSWIFFTNHDLGGALIEILALWLAIAATIAAFALVRRSAAALLVPYLAWTTFAAILTAAIWQMNR